MEHQKIDHRARVWIVTRGPDGGIEERLDPSRLEPQFLTSLGTASSAEEIADVLAKMAGAMEVAETRVW